MKVVSFAFITAGVLFRLRIAFLVPFSFYQHPKRGFAEDVNHGIPPYLRRISEEQGPPTRK